MAGDNGQDSAPKEEPTQPEERAPETPPEAADSEAATPTTTATHNDRLDASRLRPSWGVVIFLIWLIAAVMGTAVPNLPREAFILASDGSSLVNCWELRDRFDNVINAEGEQVGLDGVPDNQWCSYGGLYFGADYPYDEVTSGTGGITLDGLTWDYAIEIILNPQTMLTAALGAAGIFSLFVFARATGTLRAGLAAMIAITFLGLLVFPASLTYSVPSDLRAELVTAWTWVIAAYFGSEAAVQAFKVRNPGSEEVGGDLGAPVENPPKDDSTPSLLQRVRPSKKRGTGAEEVE